MPRAGQRNKRIVFLRAPTTEDDYGQPVPDWDNATEVAVCLARVRFGTAQEKREAAKEGGVQAATFECLRTTTLDGIVLTDGISFDGSTWDIIERAPLERDEIRFTGVREL